MTPDEKEQLVLALKESGRTCMMCGDGANDVGALKQAQVRFTLIYGTSIPCMTCGHTTKYSVVSLMCMFSPFRGCLRVMMFWRGTHSWHRVL